MLERFKGHTHKCIGRKTLLKVMKFRVFQGVSRVFSGNFREFQGIFRAIFRAIFYWTLLTMTPMERTEHHFGPFWEKGIGTISGGPFFSRPLCFTAESAYRSNAFFHRSERPDGDALKVLRFCSLVLISAFNLRSCSRAVP